MDDETDQMVFSVADYVLVSLWVEIGAAALVLLGCLVLARRSRVTTLLGAAGALVGGVSTVLVLVLLTGTWVNVDLLLSDRFWKLTNVARAVGLALVCGAVTLALARDRRRPRPTSAAA